MELIIVITMIGILSVVGTSRFFNNTSFQERGLFNDTLAALRYAQKRSVATQCQVQVNISTNTEYRLAQDANCNATSPSYTQQVRNPGSGNADYFNNQFAIQQIPLNITPPLPVTFNALGQSINGDMTLLVGTLSIKIVGATGLICTSGVGGCPN